MPVWLIAQLLDSPPRSHRADERSRAAANFQIIKHEYQWINTARQIATNERKRLGGTQKRQEASQRSVSILTSACAVLCKPVRLSARRTTRCARGSLGCPGASRGVQLGGSASAS